MQAEKENMGALNLHCSYYISKIVWWLPMFDFGIFCHQLRLMGIYRMVAPPSGYLKSFVLTFLFFLFCFFFFSILHFLFFPLSRGPFSSGAPGHCPPMPPSRYATGHVWIQHEKYIQMNTNKPRVGQVVCEITLKRHFFSIFTLELQTVSKAMK